MLALKAQSAMEYIMSYGWAIIIVLIIIGALYELGTFSTTSLSSRAAPGTCSVARGGIYSNSGPTLLGKCQGNIPEYVLTSINQVAGSYVVATGPGLDSVNGSFSISFWVSTVYPNMTQIVVARQGGYGICFGGKAVKISDSVGHTYGAPLTANRNQWYFIALSYDNSTGVAQIYVNGSNIGSSSESNLDFAHGTHTIYFSGTKSGTECGTNTGYGLTGLLSNVQLYSKTLDSSEIRSLYLNGIGAPPINLEYLAGWWPLNGNYNDYSGYNDTAIVVGNGNNFTAFWTGTYTSP